MWATDLWPGRRRDARGDAAASVAKTRAASHGNAMRRAGAVVAHRLLPEEVRTWTT